MLVTAPAQRSVSDYSSVDVYAKEIQDQSTTNRSDRARNQNVVDRTVMLVRRAPMTDAQLADAPGKILHFRA